MIRNKTVLILCFGLILSVFACKRGDLRGVYQPSKDGKTYLVVADDNGGACPLKLDGAKWAHAKGEAGLVRPGRHTLTSCIDVSFNIKEGTIYTFDYWGP